MNFIEDNLETILHHLNQINPDTKPLWGTMTPQRMIEHLTQGVLTGFGKIEMTCPYEGEKLARSREFLLSNSPMPKNFKANFVNDDEPLRNTEFELAIDEFIEAWVDFEEYCHLNPDSTHVHPVFGPLTLTEWRWMHRKHITHHLSQFGIEINTYISPE